MKLPNLDFKTVLILVLMGVLAFTTACQTYDRAYVEANHAAAQTFGEALKQYIQADEIEDRQKELQIQAVNAWQELNAEVRERMQNVSR